MAIYVTGDIHASYDIQKLSSSQFDASGLSKNDYVIICGDFGLVWQNTPSEQYWLRWLDAKPFTTLFVDGNHEGFHTLNALPTETWHGGQVHQINDSVYHLMRGELFDIDGLTFFTMGGAASSKYDKQHRKEGIGWFPEEVPSQEEREHAEEALSRANWKCDYVITHCAPTSCKDDLGAKTNRLQIHPMDEYTNWLDSIRQQTTYTHWFCGHYHLDAKLNNNITVLYNNIVKLPEQMSGSTKETQKATVCEQSKGQPYQLVDKPKVQATGSDPFATLEDDIE